MSLLAKAGAAPHRAELAAAETKHIPHPQSLQDAFLVSSGNNRSFSGLDNGTEPT
jgi:hypothetical protein